MSTPVALAYVPAEFEPSLPATVAASRRRSFEKVRRTWCAVTPIRKLREESHTHEPAGVPHLGRRQLLPAMPPDRNEQDDRQTLVKQRVESRASHRPVRPPSASMHGPSRATAHCREPGNDGLNTGQANPPGVKPVQPPARHCVMSPRPHTWDSPGRERPREFWER